MDRMQKPVVAALNGLAMGGGLEVAIRCHRMVAMQTAVLQFPEITLGILPGIGGCVVPYRKWPQGAALFHDMICFGKPLKAPEAAEIGMVAHLARDQQGLIQAALEAVTNLQGTVRGIPDGKVDISVIDIPDTPRAGNQPLSREAVTITAQTIQKSAATENLAEALEIGYRGFGEIACTDAAKEGISAFLERRKPEFKR
jgi:enoyl-CoA hydratase/3-hydroxyacyl-CoA dehydrogenase